MDKQMIYTPLTMEDSEEFFRLAGDERVAATMRFNRPHTRKESDQILSDYLTPANHTYAIRFDENSSLLGVFAFKGEVESDTAALSQMLIPEQWGKGLGKQIMSDMVQLAQTKKWYTTLEAYILETNIPSRRMVEGCGFQQKERCRYPGMTEDLLIYQLKLETKTEQSHS